MACSHRKAKSSLTPMLSANALARGAADMPRLPPVDTVGKSKIRAITTRRTFDVFVPRLSPDTADSDITDCVAVLLDTQCNDAIRCERLHSKCEDLYASYYVSVLVPALEMRHVIGLLMSADSWPVGILARRYFKPKPAVTDGEDSA
jgi:hypothetical protein